MTKKYMIYIILLFGSFFSFNLNINAKAETIDMKITSETKNFCVYDFDGVEIKLGTDSDGKLIKGIPQSGKTYDILNGAELNDSDFNGTNNCQKIYAYKIDYSNMINNATMDENDENYTPGKIEIKFYFNKEDGNVGIQELVKEVSGKQKAIRTKCIYTAGGETFTAIYDPTKTQDNLSFKFSMDSTGLTSATEEARKNWQTNSNGLICRDDIIIDICKTDTFSVDYMTVRTKNTSISGTCSKSTDDGKVTIKVKDSTYNSNQEILYLSNICTESKEVMKVMRVIGYMLMIIKILIPIGLIAIGIINFAKVLISGDDSALKKNAMGFVWNIIAAIVVFILPTIINFVIGLIDGATDGTEDYKNCRVCIFEPKDCEIPE